MREMWVPTVSASSAVSALGSSRTDCEQATWRLQAIEHAERQKRINTCAEVRNNIVQQGSSRVGTALVRLRLRHHLGPGDDSTSPRRTTSKARASEDQVH